MRGIVHAAHQQAVLVRDNLADSARILGNAPIRGQGQAQRVQQQGALAAVMTDHYHGVVAMRIDNQAQCVRDAHAQLLQRIAARKPRQMR